MGQLFKIILKMKIQEFVDGAFYINVDHRTDKNQFMIEQFKKLGLENFVERFSGISPYDTVDFRADDSEKMFLLGSAGSRSHKEVIRIAKNRGYKNVLVFEDDALFYEKDNYNGLTTVELALDELSKINDWDIFYLGANIADSELNLHSEHLIKCQVCICTHAYILNSKHFDKVIENGFDRPWDFLDIFFNDVFKNKYVSYPISVIQKGGLQTDIGGVVSMGEEFWLSHYDKKIIKHF
jgi:hypothetical protein